jgi:Zn-dependent protease with chaperone function
MGTFIVPMLIVFPLPILAWLFGSGPMARVPDLHDQARLISQLAVLLLGSSIGSVVLVAACVALSLHSQRLQYISLRTGWLLLRPISLFQVIGQGVLLVALSYYVTAVFTGYVYPKLVLAAGIFVLVASIACISAVFRSHKESGELHGRRLEAGQLGRLGERLERICGAMQQRLPENIIVGIDDNFFVTESPVTVNGRTYHGRSLFLSLPLLGRLNLDEANAVFAHEMAHLSGNDTIHGQRIGALLNSFDAQLRAMHGGMATPVFRFLLFFRALYELSLSRLGREREFRADKIAAQLVDRKPMALALAKVSAFCSFRAQVESSLFNSTRGLMKGSISQHIAAGFEQFVANADLNDDILQNHATHPFDRHPSFADRLRNIGYDAAMLRREDIAAVPKQTWRGAIVDGVGIEAALWAEYESQFKIAHEEQAAYRLRPDNEAEAAIVRRHFPDRVIEGTKGAVLAIDFSSISFSQWDAKIAMRDIRDIQMADGIGGRKLIISVRGPVGGKTFELPLKMFAGQAQGVADMIAGYYARHVESVRYRASVPKRRDPEPLGQEDQIDQIEATDHVAEEQAIDPTPRLLDPPPTEGPVEIPVLPLQTVAVADSSLPIPPPRTGLVRPEAGVVNGRYETLDGVDDWELGRMQRCRDRKTGEAVLCIRAGAPTESGEHLLLRIQAVAKLRLPGLITPIRVLRARNYVSRQPGSGMSDGDVVLVMPDTGSQPLLAKRPKAGPGATSLVAAMRILRPLAVLFDACQAAGVDLARMELDQIRLDTEQRVVVFLTAPWIPGYAGCDQDLVMDPTHPRASDPATITAALAAMLLAEPADLRLHVCQSGLHRTIPGIPFAANRLLSQQLAGTEPLPHHTADSFLDNLQLNHRVLLESYLDDRQVALLRDRHELDEDDILAVISEAVRRTRPGTSLLEDQSPSRLPQRDLDAAIASIRARRSEDSRVERLGRATIGLAVGTGIASLLVLLLWWFSNDGPEPGFQPLPDDFTQGSIRAAFTRDQFFSDSFPSRCYTHIPIAGKVAFYIQAMDVPAGSLDLVIIDQLDHQIGHFPVPNDSSFRWAYITFPTKNLPNLTRVTGQIRMNGRTLLEQTLPVYDAWFDGVGRFSLTLLGLWTTAGLIGAYLRRKRA